jgi:hypothetical protein
MHASTITATWTSEVFAALGDGDTIGLVKHPVTLLSNGTDAKICRE